MKPSENDSVQSRLICLAAILRNEEPFLPEWIVYHRMLGINHFYLYDDNPLNPLKELLKPYQAFVTVIPWYTDHEQMLGRNRQTKAYEHSIMKFGHDYEWITFIDGDEFIVLEKHDHLADFLAGFTDVGRIFLNWYVFGHNGYFNNPAGLITASLTRRMKTPSIRYKSITRTNIIEAIVSAHRCEIAEGWPTVDASNRAYVEGSNLFANAHINHYQCRSFLNWMARVTRGNTHSDEASEQWKSDYDASLKQFVTTVALNKNEFEDTFMLKYKDFLLNELASFKRSDNLTLI